MSGGNTFITSEKTSLERVLTRSVLFSRIKRVIFPEVKHCRERPMNIDSKQRPRNLRGTSGDHVNASDHFWCAVSSSRDFSAAVNCCVRHARHRYLNLTARKMTSSVRRGVESAPFRARIAHHLAPAVSGEFAYKSGTRLGIAACFYSELTVDRGGRLIHDYCRPATTPGALANARLQKGRLPLMQWQGTRGNYRRSKHLSFTPGHAASRGNERNRREHKE